MLSFVMLGGDIQYKVGVNETNVYGCLCCEAGIVYDAENCTTTNGTLSIIYTEKMDVYDTFTAGGALSHTVGYWLAVLAIVGFIGILVSLTPDGLFRRGSG